MFAGHPVKRFKTRENELMKVRFIIGPGPRQKRFAEKVTDAVRERLEAESGIFEVKSAQSKAHAGDLSMEAVKRGFEAVFACGDAVTVNRAAAPLVDTPAALGIVSRGSSAGLALSLGIPLDIDGAVGLLRKWKIRPIDVGVVCGRYFLSTAECAVDALMSKRRAAGFLKNISPTAAQGLPLLVWEYLRHKPREVFIKTSSYAKNITPLFLVAANTDRGANSFVSAPEAAPDDGALDVCYVPDKGLSGATAAIKKLISGKINGATGFERIRTEKMEIIAKGTTTVFADGEAFECPGTITLGILPKKLNVFVS